MASSYIPNTDIEDFQLSVYDLNSYALLSVVDFGSSEHSGGMVSGVFKKLVRWGNAGLALLSVTDPTGYKGNGGLFLIDGAAVNPGVAPDASAGISSNLLSSISSLSPEAAAVGSSDVSVVITGQNFTPDSVACWNCSPQQSNYLPTAYVSTTKLNVTIPASVLSAAGPLSISVFDASTNSFSRNSLPFTVLAPPTSSSTTVSVLNLSGLDMGWDATHQMLYVSTGTLDPVYPNSIVALDPATATIAKTQFVGSEPAFLDVSADGQYLYVGYDGETNETRLSLPGLDSPLRHAWQRRLRRRPKGSA